MITAVLAADAIALHAMAAIGGSERPKADLALGPDGAINEAAKLGIEHLAPVLREFLCLEEQSEGLKRVLRDHLAALHRVVVIVVHD